MIRLHPGDGGERGLWSDIKGDDILSMGVLAKLT